jgi:hypothetical protein
MIYVHAGLEKNIKSAAENKRYIMDDNLVETITILLLKVTALEKILIDKKIISKEEYTGILDDTLAALQKAIFTSGNKIN